VELSAGYKQTEVGLIPIDWVLSTVGHEFEIKLGKMIDAEKNFGVLKPYIGNKAVQWIGIDVEELSMVKLSRADLTRFRLRTGDLVVCEGGEVGRAAIWTSPIEECYFQKALHRLRPLRGFEPRLMAAMLKHWSDRGLLANYVTQTSIAHLPREKFLEIPMAVPSQSEQRAIAAALSDVDALLAKLDQLIAKKRDLKQAAMQQLLTGKTRLPGFSGEWEERPLSSVVADLEAGVSVNSIECDRPLSSGEPCILKTSAIFDGKFDPEECKLIDRHDSIRARLSPRRDTIIVSRMNTPNLVGEVGYVPADFPSLNLPDRLWMTRFDSSAEICARWLSQMLSSNQVKGRIKELATGTSGSMKNIGKSVLLALQLKFPSGNEQTAIATILSDMDADITALETRRDKTRTLKQGMMQVLLTGQIRLV
jgi:type I restriction enzyme, S subunit